MRTGVAPSVVAAAAGFSLIKAFAVDAHGRGDNDSAHPMFQHRFQQDSGAQIVGADIPGDLVHRLADSNLRSQVHDAVDALQCPRDGAGIAHITDDQLSIVETRRDATGMHLLDQRIEDSDAIAVPQKFRGDGAADETGTPLSAELSPHRLLRVTRR